MTRAGETGHNPSAASDQQIEAIWREALPRLIRYISTFVPPDEARDVAQDTAAKAIRAQIPFDDADDLLRWCQVVARRQLTDHHRHKLVHRTQRLDPDQPDPTDPIEEVHTRALLQRTLAAIHGLPAVERDALLGVLEALPAPDDRCEQLRLAAARYRARIQLRKIVGYPWVLVEALTLGSRVRRSTTRAVALAPAAVLMCVALAPYLGHPAHTMPVPQQKTPNTPVETVSDLRPDGASHASNDQIVPARPPVGHTAPRPPSARPIASVSGPGGISSTLDNQPPPGDKHLLCTQGNILPSTICVR